MIYSANEKLCKSKTFDKSPELWISSVGSKLKDGFPNFRHTASGSLGLSHWWLVLRPLPGCVGQHLPPLRLALSSGHALCHSLGKHPLKKRLAHRKKNSNVGKCHVLAAFVHWLGCAVLVCFMQVCFWLLRLGSIQGLLLSYFWVYIGQSWEHYFPPV